MTVQQMRDAIVSVYDTSSWKKKVSNMYDDQVIAVYYKFAEKGLLGKVVRRENPSKVQDGKNTEPKYYQISMDDILNEEELAR